MKTGVPLHARTNAAEGHHAAYPILNRQSYEQDRAQPHALKTHRILLQLNTRPCGIRQLNHPQRPQPAAQIRKLAKPFAAQLIGTKFASRRGAACLIDKFALLVECRNE